MFPLSRLETALKHAIQDCLNCDAVTTILKNVYSFYSKSPKRTEHLKRFCKTTNVDYFTPLRIMDVRWVSSHFRASKTIFIHYTTLVKHLENILVSPYFRSHSDRDTRRIVRNLLKMLKRKYFLETLALLVDAQYTFKVKICPCCTLLDCLCFIVMSYLR